MVIFANFFKASFWFDFCGENTQTFLEDENQHFTCRGFVRIAAMRRREIVACTFCAGLLRTLGIVLGHKVLPRWRRTFLLV